MKSNNGFTLIELLVTIVIGAILAAIAMPSFTNLMQNNRLVAQTNNLVASLNYARSEAIKQDNPSGVSVNINGSSWTNGWNVCCAAGTATNLQSVGALSGGVTLSAKASSDGSAAAIATFLPNGTLSGATSSLIFTFCDARGATYANDVEVDLAGRIQTAQKPGYRADQVTALTCE